VKAIFLLLTHVLYLFLHLFLLPNQGCRRDDITQESNSLGAPKKKYNYYKKDLGFFVTFHNMEVLYNKRLLSPTQSKFTPHID